MEFFGKLVSSKILKLCILVSFCTLSLYNLAKQILLFIISHSQLCAMETGVVISTECRFSNLIFHFDFLSNQVKGFVHLVGLKNKPRLIFKLTWSYF